MFRRPYTNAIQIGSYIFLNSIRIDGSLAIVRHGRIVRAWDLPSYVIVASCTIAEVIDPSDTEGGR